MIYDLTKSLIKARNCAETWSQNTFEEFIKLMVKEIAIPIAVDWDSGAGEGWASIFHQITNHDKELIALVRLDAPLVIILAQWDNNIKQTVEKTQVVAIKVIDMETECYSIDPSKINFIFPNDFWSSTINPSKFSINDLWYTTI